MTTINSLPIIHEGYIYYKCGYYNGEGTVIVLSENNGPSHRDTCEFCHGIGIVKTALSHVALVR